MRGGRCRSSQELQVSLGPITVDVGMSRFSNEKFQESVGLGSYRMK